MHARLFGRDWPDMLVDDKAVGARLGDRDQRALPLVRPHVADMGIVALIALDEGVAPRVADQRGRDAHRAARVEDVEYRPVIGGRSEERRVGNESVSTCRSRWTPYH